MRLFGREVGTRVVRGSLLHAPRQYSRSATAGGTEDLLVVAESTDRAQDRRTYWPGGGPVTRQNCPRVLAHSLRSKLSLRKVCGGSSGRRRSSHYSPAART